MPRTNHLFRGWVIVGWAALAVCLMAAVLLARHGVGEEGVRTVIRATARTSFALFLSAFVASALRRVWPGRVTAWMVENRRYLGVSFAASHLVHAAAIVAMARVTSGASIESTGKVELVGGLVAYLFIAAMVATSFDRTARWLGPRSWARLHTVGMYYNWMVFMFSYGGRAVVSAYYIPLALILVAAVVLRVIAAKKPRRLVAAKGA